MTHVDLVALAQQAVSKVVKSGDIVIDATLGNGYDAMFLAGMIGDDGHLFGFDIQPAAITATKQRLAEKGWIKRATLLLQGHETICTQIPEQYRGIVKAVMFNLGYLPGNDHSVRTHITTTLHALECAHAVLARNGVISVIAYTGHEHGREETEQVKAWARDLESSGYRISLTVPPSRHHNAPELILFRRIE